MNEMIAARKESMLAMTTEDLTDTTGTETEVTEVMIEVETQMLIDLMVTLADFNFSYMPSLADIA